MPFIWKYVNGAAMVALLIFSVTVALPSLISAKDSSLVTMGFLYIAVLVPVLYLWARKVFFTKK